MITVEQANAGQGSELEQLREEVRRLRAELDAAWAAAATPVRGMVTLAEVIEGRRDAFDELRAREATLLDAINAVREAVAK